jgi:serine/threonine protein kinase
VWRAYDEKLQRQVAVKAMPRASASADRRAEREARAAARLNHPGIVALYELGEDDRAVYLVSELVEGRTLAELEDEGDVSDRDIAEVGIAMCEALAHAHGKGVIHRDVKPQNVLVAAEVIAAGGSDADARRVLLAGSTADLVVSDDGISWAGVTVPRTPRAGREALRGIGSCSFREPVDELSALGIGA